MGGPLVRPRSQLNISNMQINMSWFAALPLRFAGTPQRSTASHDCWRTQCHRGKSAVRLVHFVLIYFTIWRSVTRAPSPLGGCCGHGLDPGVMRTHMRRNIEAMFDDVVVCRS